MLKGWKCILLALLIFISGCAHNKIHSGKIEHVDEHPPNLAQSANYYSLAQAALEEKDFETAVLLLKKADEAYPDNIYVKEELFSLLNLLGFFNPDYRKELISLGEKYYAENRYSEQILMDIAQNYFLMKNNKQAEKFFRLAVQTKPTIENLTALYLFEKETNPPPDSTLLTRAKNLPWNDEDEDEVISLAELFETENLKEAEKILLKAYERWDDEKTLRALISVYEKENKDEEITALIQERLDNHKFVSDRLKKYLIAHYYIRDEYEKILKNAKLCFEVGTTDILKYLFFSAVIEENYELAEKTGIILENAEDFPEELKSSFHAFFGEVCYRRNKPEKALEHFLKSEDIHILLGIFKDLAMNPQKDEKRLQNLLESLLKKNENSDFINFLCGYTFALLKYQEKADKLLKKVSPDFIRENNLYFTAAMAYLLNPQNIKDAEAVLNLREENNPTANEFIGLYYYENGNDSLAFEFFQKEISSNPKPAPRVFIFASLILEKEKKIEEMLSILEKAVEIYPKDAEILNTYGYSIAKYEVSDKYPLAEKLLKKALKLRSEDAMIWDSLAWLYYRMGKYKKAIQAMEIPLQEIKYSEIAYHLGEIYLKLNQRELSKKYLNLAVELSTDDESVQLAKQILETENMKNE